MRTKMSKAIHVFLMLAVLTTTTYAEGGAGHGSTRDLGIELPLWSGLPFAGILLSIALFPLINKHFWHNHFGKISALWAALFAVPFLAFYRGAAFYEILHILIADYFPFIILLWALFTISGGIMVRGTLRGTPTVNCLMLLIGTSIASLIGTTGAAMVMIRPLLRANHDRRYKAHLVVFFIFLVANIGGSLTPLGDPPLFLGFLHGVPFTWTFHCLGPMLTVSFILLVVAFFLDRHYYRKEWNFPGFEKTRQSETETRRLERIGIEGNINFGLLAVVIFGIMISGTWKAGELSLYGIIIPIQNLVRDAILIGMGLLSLKVTPKGIREANGFNWEPIREVAFLFAGIFMTIIPVLLILKAGAEGSMAAIIGLARDPIHFFWLCGGLSSFLDNAPTYLTFFNTALGYLHLTEAQVAQGLRMAPTEWAANFTPEVAARLEEFVRILIAISCGAVFMGANTYIGNAPNFMVKSVAEESGIEMPSFFGYLFKYSIPILIPLFVLVTFLFF